MENCGKKGAKTFSGIYPKTRSEPIKLQQISSSTNQSIVANYVKTRLSFELVRSQVAYIRGARKMQKMNIDTAEMDIAEATSEIAE